MPLYFPPNPQDPNDLTHFRNQEAQWMEQQQQQMNQNIKNAQLQNQIQQIASRPTRIYIGPSPLMIKLAYEHPFVYVSLRVLQFLLSLLLIYFLLYFFFPDDLLQRLQLDGLFQWMDDSFIEEFKYGFWEGVKNGLVKTV